MWDRFQQAFASQGWTILFWALVRLLVTLHVKRGNVGHVSTNLHKPWLEPYCLGYPYSGIAASYIYGWSCKATCSSRAQLLVAIMTLLESRSFHFAMVALLGLLSIHGRCRERYFSERGYCFNSQVDINSPGELSSRLKQILPFTPFAAD